MITLENSKSVQRYDFGHSDHISKNQLRSLNFIHDKFAKNFSSAASAFLRTSVEFTLGNTVETSYGQFLAEARNPTCLALLSLQPLDGSAVLEVPPEIAFPLIDRLLGGEGRLMANVRPITEIEQRVLQAFFTLLIDNLRQSWSPVCAVQFNLGVVETQPDQLQAMSQTEPVMLIDFQIRMNDVASVLRLALAMGPLEPVFQSFEREPGIRRTAVRDEAMSLHLGGVPAGVGIETAETVFPMRSLISLQKGDTLLLDQRDEWPLLLKVAGRHKLYAQARKDTTRRAFTIIARDRAVNEEVSE